MLVLLYSFPYDRILVKVRKHINDGSFCVRKMLYEFIIMIFQNNFKQVTNFSAFLVTMAVWTDHLPNESCLLFSFPAKKPR